MRRRGVRAGVLAAAALAAFYIVVVAGASGSWQHLTDQAGADWYYLLPIIAGFGLQVGLLSELRRRHRLHHAETAAGGTGAGASTVGMVVGIGVNAVGVAVAARRLHQESEPCLAA